MKSRQSAGTIVLSLSAMLALALSSCKSTPATDTTTPDFQLGFPSNGPSVAPGNSTTVTVTINRYNSFGDAVTLSSSGAAAGITGSFSPPAPTGTTSTFTISVASSVAAGSYSILVTGTSGTLVHSQSLPITVTAPTGGSSVVGISAGEANSCAVKSSGVAYCWGFNGFGQLGDGTITARTNPTLVSGGLAFTSIATGETSTCGLVTSGAAYCWGENPNGVLGDGSVIDRHSPTAVTGGLFFSTISVTSNTSRACGRTTTGVGECWGGNPHGEFGNGAHAAFGSTVPTGVTGGFSFNSLQTGNYTTCGLVGTAAYCWGFNNGGQVGNGTVYGGTSLWDSPTLVSGGLAFTSLAVGQDHVCGLTAAGVAYCWGNNTDGELGDNTTTSRTAPTLVAGGHTFTSLSAGKMQTCGIATGGQAYCWGSNFAGMIGDGTTVGVNRQVPTLVYGGMTFTSISTGTIHTCGVSSGVVYCWGGNADGQLGDGTLTNRSVPTAVVVP